MRGRFGPGALTFFIIFIIFVTAGKATWNVFLSLSLSFRSSGQDLASLTALRAVFPAADERRLLFLRLHAKSPNVRAFSRVEVMAARHLRTHISESDPIPWVSYFIGVGGTLMCLLFAADAYLPKAPARPAHEIERTTLPGPLSNQRAALMPAAIAQADGLRPAVATR